MKKITTISMLVLTLAVPAAFGQGYFQFTTGKSQAWDGFTSSNAVSTLTSNVKVAFLWAAASTATPMPLTSTPTTSTNGATTAWTAAAAWGTITNTSDSWTLATRSDNSLLVSINTAANGGISYNGGVSFGVAGTVADTIYSIFIIGWNGAQYANLFDAANAGGAVGWSSVFQYTSKLSNGTTASMAAQGANFGVSSPFVSGGPVPEPSTLALAALGGASLLLFRRRNSK